MAAAFGGLDLILMPTLPSRVPTTAEWLARAGGDFSEYLRFTIPADLTGGPTITFPASFDSGGRPITMQLYGPHLSEALLCQAGAAFQRATDWHLRHPQD
jgi:amidase